MAQSANVKPLIAGVIGAVAAMLIWAALSLAISGSGGLGAMSVEFPNLIAGAVGFVAGFYWKYRRAKGPRNKH